MKKNNGFIFIILFILLLSIGIICINATKTKPVNTLFVIQNNIKPIVFACDNGQKDKPKHATNGGNFIDSFSNLLSNKNKTKADNTKVMIGGQTIGMTFDTEGAIVIGLNEFLTINGLASPAIENDISIGDVIIEINDKKIYNSASLSETLQSLGDNKFKLKTKRGSIYIEKEISAKYDIISKTYKLGLWVKDSSSGIGTVTFIKEDGTFASLGHPVVDSKTGEIIKVENGSIYNCQLLSIEKGEKGKAGELRGIINNQNKIGTIYQNNKYGVYGKFTPIYPFAPNSKIIEIAETDEVCTGKASIYCSIDNGTPQEYEIEIIKTSPQNTIEDKGLVIRVTDNRLIELAGGIVQGMSGSPIIQNNKLVGAITHVFINDPTKGYGIYADWMLKTLENIQK